MKKFNQIGLVTLSTLGVLAAVPALADTTDTGTSGISPITNFTNQDLSIGKIIGNITTWVLGFSAAVAVLFLIVGGLQYITASGNEKRAEAAKSTILYAVIGLVVILLAYVVVGFLKQNLGGAIGTTGN